VLVVVVAVVVVVAFGGLFLAVDLAAVLMAVAWWTRWLAIQAFIVTARWPCHPVIRNVEQ
jgi:hypothetical protein